jgi:hypothetical protein
MCDLRGKFLHDVEMDKVFGNNQHYLVVAVRLPTGAIEIITNTQQIESKIEYYKNAYDDNFCLKTNTAIQIIGYMLV